MHILSNLKKICGTNKEQPEMSSCWSFNSSANRLTCSDYFMELCGMTSTHAELNDFLLLVHPDHSNRVRREMSSLVQSGSFKDQFPLLTKYGYRWVNFELTDKTLSETGDTVFNGTMEFLDYNDVVEAKNVDTDTRTNDLINRYVSVSSSLMHLLNSSERDSAILETLNSLVNDIDGDRAYIFEYNLENGTQSCIYEVVRNSVRAEKNELQNLPLSGTKWWTEMLLEKGQPVVCDDISELPSEEYEILEPQKIQSLIVVPLLTKNGVGGYLGVDSVGRKRQWSDIDRQWFQSVANIISLCIELKKSENAEKIEREKYVRLYESMPVGFVRVRLIYDEQGKPVDYIHIDINSVAKDLLGVSYHGIDVIDKMASEIDKDEFDSRLQLFDELIKTKGVRKVSAYADKKGNFFDYTIYSVERDELVILMQDNTAAVVANKALRKSEETLKNIYKNIPVGIEIYDHKGYLLSVNEMEKEIFGFGSDEEVIGVNLFENPNVPESFIEDLINNGPAWCDLVYDFAKIGSYYDSACQGKKHIVLKGSVLYDAEGNVENYLLIVLDNTDFLRANHKIHEFELLFNSIADFAKVGLSQWNPCDRTIKGTDQWYDNLNLGTRDMVEIMDAYVNAFEEDQHRIHNNFRNMVAGKIDSFRDEIRIKTHDGYKWLRCNYKMVNYRPDENIIEIIGINIDITELKNTETKLLEAKHRAEESDRLKSAFLANMSHEIRTPLNAILGFSDLLIDADDASDKQQYISIIRQNNELLLQLISDILDISKIESGTLDIQKNLIDVNSMCEEVVNAQSMKIDKDIKIEFETKEDECFIISDKNRVTQVLGNLVGNAIKFTQQGTISVGYNVKGDEIEFYVRDTGIGIPEEQLPNVFNRFVKLNSFASGTGLGLPICRSIIEKMEGKIWGESELGVGSCFKFALPYDMSDGKIGSISPYLSNKLYNLKNKDMEEDKPTILVAEDTDSNYLLVSTILKNDYNLIRAYNGKEAVQLFETHAPKLVIMDMKMPEMDGVEATHLIKEIDNDIPVIMLTAFAYDDDKNRALEAGCSDFITKPIHPNGLQEIIKKYL